jgi:hypothetical protein
MSMNSYSGRVCVLLGRILATGSDRDGEAGARPMACQTMAAALLGEGGLTAGPCVGKTKGETAGLAFGEATFSAQRQIGNRKSF